MASIVLGLGKTGLSCLRYLKRQGQSVIIMDSRESPPGLEALRQQFPEVPVTLGAFDAAALCAADQLIISPGISLDTPAVAAAIAKGVPYTSDIGLFLSVAKAPIIAITGSNAKSTVTTLVGEVFVAAGYAVQVCGNIGMPVLDTLSAPVPDYYVIELSSFQLALAPTLEASVAVVLNVTPDHLDRHHTLENYLSVKQRVYAGCAVAVCNADAPWIWSSLSLPEQRFAFSLTSNGANTFGLLREKNSVSLAFEGHPLLSCSALMLKGKHYWQNCLAVLAIAQGIGIAPETVLPVLSRFQGLPHRCQWVAHKAGVDWYNDSKGTNVGACIAALEGLSDCYEHPLVLIAGGDAKGADLSELLAPIQRAVGTVVLLGKDAPLFEACFEASVPHVRVGSMEEAVAVASEQAIVGSAVLLSPACASYDMFRDYVDRGECFMAAVERL